MNAPGSYGAVLSGIACVSNSFCMTAGAYGLDVGSDLTLTEFWNNKTWTILPPASPPPEDKELDYFLDGASCFAASRCVAVGLDKFTGVPLAEIQFDTTWALSPVVQPAQATYGGLLGVSCPGVDGAGAPLCMAVGFYEKTSPLIMFPLTEMLSANGWNTETVPLPAGAVGAILNGVSCTSATACTAVGLSVDPFGNWVALAEAWNGHTWAIQPFPEPPGTQSSVLNGVSCSSPSSCIAVGYYQDSAGTVIADLERWAGSSWTMTLPPLPAGTQRSDLNGVSCSSVSSCTLVGYYQDSAGILLTMAELQTGSTWHLSLPPNPSGTTRNNLLGVSCSSAVACTAVGFSTGSSHQDAELAEALNGSTWTIRPTPSPLGLQSADLLGVSCSSATTCTAVGAWSSSGHVKTLALTGS